MTTFTANRISLLSLGLLALMLTACEQTMGGSESGVSVSSRAIHAGVSRYTLLEGDTTDVLQEQNADGMVLGTWERNRNTGVATQAWTDSDRNIWELSSATGCLSRNGTCLDNTELALDDSGGSLANQGLAVQAERSVAAQEDLNRYLDITNPFDVSQYGGQQISHLELQACVAVFDIFCSTSIECAAMGGTFECGLFATRCCF